MDTTAENAGSSRASRIAVDVGAEPGDWEEIHRRLSRPSAALSELLVRAAAGAGALLGLLSVAAAAGLTLREIYPDVSVYVILCLVLPPGILAGAVAGQFAGNMFLRLRFRLDDASRRGFATRLTLARAPETWPVSVRRWLFTGDWLGSPVFDLRLPYVRIFVMGDAPAACREEDGLWREIHGLISGDSLWEAGSNHREISYPRQLPRWARQVEKGDGFSELQSRIGSAAAGEWVGHLWRRACRQWPALGANHFPGRSRRECFEIHSLVLSGGREALAVILRPSSFVAELSRVDAAENAAA